MSSRANKVAYNILIVFLKGVSKLPFGFLYGLSTFFSYVFQYIVGYRKNVVMINLQNAYPEKTEKEIKKIVRAFYLNLTDTMLESIKAWSMTREQFEQRMKFSNSEMLEKFFKENKNLIVLSMHYANWEWAPFVQTYMKHRYLVVYNEVRGNSSFEKFLNQMRTRWGAEMVASHQTARLLMRKTEFDTPIALVLLADQRPPNITSFWTTFLNQETSFISGPEKLAHRFNLPVFFFHVNRVKRGYYEIGYKLITEEPARMEPDEILLAYIREMEKYINKNPENYLWSHKRWRQQRPDNVPMIVEKNYES